MREPVTPKARRGMRPLFLLACCVSFLDRFSGAKEQEGLITCSRGWFAGSEREIPLEWIDDGYCDCPGDGADEPNTGACAGSMDGGWAGVPSSEEAFSKRGYFRCPLQPSLLLPMSRINDGICDCCEGADEVEGLCQDNCDEILAEERAALAQAKSNFATGFARRQKDIEAFKHLFEETLPKIDYLNSVDIPAVEKEIAGVQDEIKSLKMNYMQDRMGVVRDVVKMVAYCDHCDAGGGLLSLSMSLDEIHQFIMYACQLSGELADANKFASNWKNSRTCMPLRLAGIDLGFLWESEDFENGTATFRRLMGGDEDDLTEIANLMDTNEGDESDLSIGVDDKVRDDRRRHMKRHHSRNRKHYADSDEDDDDDEEEWEDDDDWSHEIEEEEDIDEVRRSDQENLEEPKTKRSEHEIKAGKKAEQESADLRTMIQSTALSLSRVPFKTRAEVLKTKIDELASSPENDINETLNNGEASAEISEESKPTVDHMAYQMVSNVLTSRLKHIERGVDYAISAKVLLDALKNSEELGDEEIRHDLIHLAVGTLYHGKLSAADVAELFYLLLPEFNPDGALLRDQGGSCPSASPIMCPPRTITREMDGGTFTFPPTFILPAVERRCEAKKDETVSEVCTEDSENSIPANIPMGYYNYYVVQPRDDSDTLTELFAPLGNLDSAHSKISELDDTKAHLEGKLNEFREKARDLEHSIGGRDGEKFGPEGELHSLRDDCYSVEEGKYTYEVCVFGKATQRDRGAKGGGTSLGQWKEITVDENTGERTMKWENGQKCWNGPKRSTIVHVTCGAETKLIDSDEPTTCTYVMNMESPIACDEAYRQRHGL